MIWFYAADWLLVAVWLWMEYLDVETTMKALDAGYVEGNPAMQPYVKAGDPGLMVIGKFKNGGWAGLLAILIFPLGLYCAWRAWSIWKSVQINEHNIGGKS